MADFVGNNAVPNGNYSNLNGRVSVTVDQTLVTAESIVKGGLKRKAQAEVTAGNRATRHSRVMAEFNKLLERVEMDSDCGRNG
jgi:hypothetical protein